MTSSPTKHGKHVPLAIRIPLGEYCVEFYPDSTSVYETVLQAFYTPVE